MLAGEMLALVSRDANHNRVLEEFVQVALVDQFAGSVLFLDCGPRLGGHSLGAQFVGQHRHRTERDETLEDVVNQFGLNRIRNQFAFDDIVV